MTENEKILKELRKREFDKILENKEKLDKYMNDLLNLKFIKKIEREIN